MTMAFKPYKDESRSNWGCTDRPPGTDELKLGALMRIAGHGSVAHEYKRLIEQRDMYERWWREARACSERLARSNASLRGQITKLRKRLAEELP